MAVELLPRAVLRAARWPVETAEAFTWHTRGYAELRRHEEDVASRRSRVTSALHAVVPHITDPGARRYVLAAKRAIHRGLDPFDPPDGAVHRVLDGTHPEALRLLEDERVDRLGLAERRRRLAADHDAEIERQRELLRRVTADQEFRRALTVANPDVASRWDRARNVMDRHRARDQRLEAAVLNYLLRAVGRPMPCGLWSGVAPVVPCEEPGGPGLTMSRREARHVATVRLQPFVSAVAALACRPRYGERSALRLNPTLHEDGAGWRYERFVDGRSEWARLEAHPMTAAILEHWGDGAPRRADGFVRRLAAGDEHRQGLLWASVRGLVVGGVLLGPLSLPAGAPSVWDALDTVAAALEHPDRGIWQRAVDAVRAECARLSDDLPGMAPEELRRRTEHVGGLIQRLWDELEVGGVVHGPVLDVDVRLPFDVGWSAQLRGRVGGAIEALLRLHGQLGLAALYRLTALRAIAAAFTRTGTSALLPAIASGAVADHIEPQDDLADSAVGIFSFRLPCDTAVLAEIGNLVGEIERTLAPVHTARSHTMPSVSGAGPVDPGRMGTLLVTVADGGITLGWGRPQPGLFVSRFADLLAEGDGEARIVTDLRQLVTGGDDGRRPAELVGADPANVEAAMRPVLTSARLDPHGPPGDNLAGATCEVGEAGVVIHRPHDPEPIVPLYNSAVAIGSVDPCSGFLLSLAMVQGWEYLSFPFPVTPGEAERWHHLPRLVLEDGSAFSPERWTIDAGAVAEMRAARGAARYGLWRGHLERRGVPDLVYLRAGDEPAALARLFPTASPLAVRCLFDAMRTDARLVLSELPAGPEALTVSDDRGRYIAELAVIWHADVVPGGASQ